MSKRVNKFKLHLRVASGADLRGADVGGSSDPFVKMYLGDDKQKAKDNGWYWKTEKVSNTVNPTWKPTFELEFTTEEIKDLPRFITFEVWDHDYMSKDDFLGQCYHGLSIGNDVLKKVINLVDKDEKPVINAESKRQSSITVGWRWDGARTLRLRNKGISSKAMRAVNTLFNELDVDRSGALEGNEIRQLVKRFYDKKNLAAVLEKFDKNDDESVSFEEFYVGWMTARSMDKDVEDIRVDADMTEEEKKNVRANLKEAFDQYDVDQSGAVEGKEFRALVTSLIEPAPKKVTEFLGFFDSDKDEKITLEELVNALSQNPDLYSALVLSQLATAKPEDVKQDEVDEKEA